MSYRHLLKVVLADSYFLLLKTQNYHWNVTGPHFYSIHKLLSDQYTELFDSIDALAELIRACDEFAPGSFKKYSELTLIKEGNENYSASEMIQDLIESQQTIMENIQNCLEKAQEEGDDVIADFMTQRLSVHKKNKWMLDASLPQDEMLIKGRSS